MELIYRDEAIKAINDVLMEDVRHRVWLKLRINNLKPVDAEPVRHGKWIMKSDPFGFFDEIPVCSECGCTTKLREKTKFCPNCGADMRGEQDE